MEGRVPIRGKLLWALTAVLNFLICAYPGLCCKEYESWVQIAQSRRKAGDDREAVRAALEQALAAAQQMNCNQKVVSVVRGCPCSWGGWLCAASASFVQLQVSLYAYMSEFYHSVGWDREGRSLEQERAEIVALDPAAAESSEEEAEDSLDGMDEGVTSTGGTGAHRNTYTQPLLIVHCAMVGSVCPYICVRREQQ